MNEAGPLRKERRFPGEMVVESIVNDPERVLPANVLDGLDGLAF